MVEVELLVHLVEMVTLSSVAKEVAEEQAQAQLEQVEFQEVGEVVGMSIVQEQMALVVK
jgi:hypothetical protein